MAYIQKINFSRVGKMEGCTCDRCGKYIQNIWTVTYKDGAVLNFGIDCFEKLNKASKLNKFGIKEMKKALQYIETHYDMLEAEKAKTEETDKRWFYIQQDKEDYWYGRSWDEYHLWMLEEFIPQRIKEDQKRIDKFSKINFER